MAKAIDGPVDVFKLATQWEGLRSSDDARQALVEQLFAMVDHTQQENKKLQDIVDNLKFHELNYSREMKKLKDENKAVHERLSAAPFVLVLVDGDNTMFNDGFVTAGAEGGHKAAQELQESLETHLNHQLGVEAHRKVIIRIYVNLSGLVGRYAKAKIVPDAHVVREFVVGFNRELPFAEFVDAGDDKEAADHKIREHLSLYWFNEHCKHIMLAGSADRGYVTFLRQFSTASDSASRLTLVEAVPFPHAFRVVATRFQVKKFKKLFRNTKITIVEDQTSPQLHAARSSDAVTTQFVPATVSPRQPKTPTIAMCPVSTSSGTSSQRKIKYNRHGQRVDEPLLKWEKDLVEALGSRSLCNRYFLSCCNDSACSHSHKGQLSSGESSALMRIARFNRCPNGTGCQDRNCVAGHHCIYDGHCNFGSECKFGLDMHNVDKTVMRTV